MRVVRRTLFSRLLAETVAQPEVTLMALGPQSRYADGSAALNRVERSWTRD
jgi:hypothetical protein